MAYLLIANLYQSKYACLENGLEIQYSMENNQYLKDLISSADIMRNNPNDDDGVQPKMSPTILFSSMYQKSFNYRRNRTNSQ